MKMDDIRWKNIMWLETERLSPEEVKEGWHFCPEWDGLLIGPGMDEQWACICKPRAPEEQR